MQLASQASGSPDHAALSLERWTSRAIALVGIMYALLAGLHTLQDFDLGWQLATGRWIVEHRQIPSTDVLSYTAHGQPWIYPVLSQVLLFLTWRAGGYSLLSWLGALAGVAAIALLRYRGGSLTRALAVLAVPLIVNRTQPRAEMFTTVLAAGVLALLWQYHSGRHKQLWMLPVAMALWVNLHLGFVAGLALCAAYVWLELCELPFSSRREHAIQRLRQAWPWLGLSVVATLLNPWGPYIYSGLTRQQSAQPLHSRWIVEWAGLRPTWGSLGQALDLRDPQSAFWWLMLVAAVACAVGLWRRRIGPSALLAAAIFLGLQHVRYQALFAAFVVVVGGTLIPEAAPPGWNRSRETSTASGTPLSHRLIAPAVLLIVASLVGVRCYDLISNRYYIQSDQLAVFGSGLATWFPERAAAFIERENLPRNLFNDYNLGGYVTWRLASYPDYIDGRALPFGDQLFFRAYRLSTDPPGSPLWRDESSARGIHTLLVSLAGYAGVAAFPQLRAFCNSPDWSPVYLDEVSAVFLRNQPETQDLARRLRLDCSAVEFHPPNLSQASPARRRAEMYRFWMNAAGVLYALGRNREALDANTRALDLFPGSAGLHLLRALTLQELDRPAEAENEFLASLQLQPAGPAWFDLGLFYMTRRRYADAAEVFRRGADGAAQPSDMLMMLGQAYVLSQRPSDALQAFDRAVAANAAAGGLSAGIRANFDSLVAAGRARAFYQLGDLPRAISFQEESVRSAPGDSRLWLGLADLYQAAGRTEDANTARSRAAALAP